MEERKRAAENRTVTEGVDPDIAGIRPGPQPLADWQVGLDDDN